MERANVNLVRILGKGSFGAVYLGYRQGDPTPYAVKVIDRTKLLEPVNKKRIRREIEIPKLLGCHKNIVCIKNVIWTPTEVMIFSRYVPNAISLEEYVLKLGTKADTLVALDLVYQLVDGLEYMHRLNVVHRDIKPSNIIMKGHIPMYIDFDLGCVEGTKELSCNGTPGTPFYAAPEVLMGQIENWFATDIYSLGVTLFYTFNGHSLPFMAPTIEELVQTMQNMLPPLSESGIKIIDDTIGQMLSFNWRDRPALATIKTEIAGAMRAL